MFECGPNDHEEGHNREAIGILMFNRFNEVSEEGIQNSICGVDQEEAVEEVLRSFTNAEERNAPSKVQSTKHKKVCWGLLYWLDLNRIRNAEASIVARIGDV